MLSCPILWANTLHQWNHTRNSWFKSLGFESRSPAGVQFMCGVFMSLMKQAYTYVHISMMARFPMYLFSPGQMFQHVPRVLTGMKHLTFALDSIPKMNLTIIVWRCINKDSIGFPWVHQDEYSRQNDLNDNGACVATSERLWKPKNLPSFLIQHVPSWSFWRLN